jgi:hypothetical protein
VLVSHLRHEDFCGVVDDGWLDVWLFSLRSIAMRLKARRSRGRGQEEMLRILGSRILLLGPAGKSTRFFQDPADQQYLECSDGKSDDDQQVLRYGRAPVGQRMISTITPCYVTHMAGRRFKH